MERVHSLKMLAVLALVLLVSSVNGRIMTKCELKAQLDAAQIYVPDNMILENLIASLVCRANGSAFNTKFVKFVTDNHDGQIPLQGSPPPRPQDAPVLRGSPKDAPVPQGFPQDAPVLRGSPKDAPVPQGFPQDAPVPRGSPKDAPVPRGSPKDAPVPRGSPKDAPVPQGSQGAPPNGPQKSDQAPPPPVLKSFPQGTPVPQGLPQGAPVPQGLPQGAPVPQSPPSPGPKSSPHDPKGPRKHKRFARQERDILPPAVWHQFGLFQLSDTVACNSGVLSSLNICKMNCSALIEDDITNDIICMNTLMQQVKPVGQVNPPAPIK
ncbi:uncharacterized protein [Misgurnus anguillicaudatus]|uniref:uncharacterized protein n=1 Tax=Misgurnus anguillicaudatus TaxID=75329 RepID=UPI003CCFB82B